MKRKNATLKALFTSVLSLLLCVSMLVGTTFAWFTDSVTTGLNTIAAGVLDVELCHSNAAVNNERVDSDTELFLDLKGNSILWEPGVVAYENLTIANVGDLALIYRLTLVTDNENFVMEDDGSLYGLSQVLKVGFVKGGVTASERVGVIESVDMSGWTTLAEFQRSGSLLPEGKGVSQQTWGVVIYWEPGESDNLWNLNNGKKLTEGDVLSIDLGIRLVATQEQFEPDSFGSDYDGGAKGDELPGFVGGSVTAPVQPDENGRTAEDVTLPNQQMSAFVPKGTKLEDGAKQLTLTVTEVPNKEYDIQLGENDEMRSLDIEIDGVAPDNDTLIQVTLMDVADAGLNSTNIDLYYVEGGKLHPMKSVPMEELDEPDEFYYDTLTGAVVLFTEESAGMALVTDIKNPWYGTVADTFAAGEGTEEEPYLVANAEQMAYFSELIDKGEDFEGEYLELALDVNLDGVNFAPIGWGYENSDYNVGGKESNSFKGVFDGGNHCISGLYQNGWDLEEQTGKDYTYTNCGLGLFASATDATIMNLKITDAEIVVECVETGILVGLAQGDCHFENIQITDSKIGNYQRATGGLIGEVSPKNENGEWSGTVTIKDIYIGSDVVVGSLWGDFDAPVGGVIGAVWDDYDAVEIEMSNVTVACRLDVYNDVTSANRWGAYRRAGMLIGNTEESGADRRATASFLTCNSVTVIYGDWANYHYCEFSNYNASYPFVRVEAGENCSAFANPRWGVPNDINGVKVTPEHHPEKDTSIHKEGDECYVEYPFDQLYGGVTGVYGQPAHAGVTVVYGGN